MHSTVIGNFYYKTNIIFKGGTSLQISLCKVDLDDLLDKFDGNYKGNKKTFEYRGYTRCPERKTQTLQYVRIRIYELACVTYYHGDEFLTI